MNPRDYQNQPGPFNSKSSNAVSKFTFKNPADLQERKNSAFNARLINNSFVVPTTSKKSENPNEAKTINKEDKVTVENYNNFQSFGGLPKDKLMVLTGSVERVIRWRSIFQNNFCFYVVMAQVISLQEGLVRMQKTMILRDKNKGPILQVVYHTNSTYMRIEDFYIGQNLRCAGTMIGPNVFNAHSIRNATTEELESLQRFCCICDRSISHFLNLN